MKYNYINASKKFCNHLYYICLYYGMTQRQHVFRAYVIHSNCARLHNFFFFMAIYTQNSEQKRLKTNNKGGEGWNKDVPGGKKSKN